MFDRFKELPTNNAGVQIWDDLPLPFKTGMVFEDNGGWLFTFVAYDEQEYVYRNVKFSYEDNAKQAMSRFVRQQNMVYELSNLDNTGQLKDQQICIMALWDAVRKLVKVEDTNLQWQKLMSKLTPGGSEYCDPQGVYDFLSHQMDELMKIKMEYYKLKNKGSK